MAECNIMMNDIRSIRKMATANFDAWIHTPRVIVMGLCLVVYSFLQAEASANEMKVNGVMIALTVPEMLFFKLNQGFFIMASLLFLVMISEIPRRIAFQEKMLLHSSRTKWILSQILYCVWMVAVTIIALSCFYILFAALFGARGLTGEFSETALINAGQYTEYESLIPQYIRSSMSAWSACLLAIIPMFLFWFSMALVILLLGLMGYQFLGPVLCGIVLFFNISTLLEAFPGVIRTPVSFSTLSSITRAYPHEEFVKLREAVAGYAIFISLFMIGLVITAKRTDLRFGSGDKE